MSTNTPSNSTPPFRIAGEDVYRTRDIWILPNGRPLTSGEDNGNDIVARVYPDRLARARAALEEACKNKDDIYAQYEDALRQVRDSEDILAAAEKEAEAVQARVEIPAVILEVARVMSREYPSTKWSETGAATLLARSHGIDPAHLRARLESETT